MTRSTTMVIMAALVAAFVVGALVAGGPNAAVAQEEDGGVDIEALTKVSPVVAAVPYQSRMEYEQDPFEPARLKRTTETVVRVMLVKADGTVEVKDVK